MQVKVVTPDKSFFDGEAESCVLPAYDGEVGILPGHAPMIARMGHGVARVSQGGTTTRVAVYGGFVKIQADEVVVLAGGAATAEGSDKTSAEKDLSAARQALTEARDGKSASAVIADLEEKVARGRALVALHASA